MPGLIVDGQFRRGVSVGDCVAAGEAIAVRALRLAATRAAVRGESGLATRKQAPAHVA
ncbi:MAG: hypothetical protein U5K74_09945 [Gemmatimonadaceae bacterium]|nr:hypothetical protein [Gemmatimonadaceae bacterium]